LKRTGKHRQYRAEQLQRQRSYQQLRDTVFGHYGKVCACCGTTANLTIDHVFGGGRAHREAFGFAGRSQLYQWLVSNEFPAGFQVLCRSCNSSKGEGKRCRLWHPRASA
jgi:5-methylcytosine-specific restriction endonuclease McrA